MDRRKKVEARSRRKKRIRKKISGVEAKPRLCVYKSLKEIYVQLIDDSSNKVITGASSLTKDVKAELKYGGNVEAAKKVGLQIGKKAKEIGIEHVVFDRNGFKYHGRIAALADGAREAGLIF
jgi:large subunit ribosomal protein L18